MQILETLEELLNQRKASLPQGSYTAKMMQCEADQMLKKVVEEAGEFTLALAVSGDTNREKAIEEAADLLFHMLLALVRYGIPLAEVEHVLKARHNSNSQTESK